MVGYTATLIFILHLGVLRSFIARHTVDFSVCCDQAHLPSLTRKIEMKIYLIHFPLLTISRLSNTKYYLKNTRTNFNKIVIFLILEFYENCIISVKMDINRHCLLLSYTNVHSEIRLVNWGNRIHRLYLYR